MEFATDARDTHAINGYRGGTVICRRAAWCSMAFFTAMLAPGADSGLPAETRSATPVQIQIRNVNLLLANDIVLGVRHLRGELRPTNPGVPVTFDRSDSFAVDADSAEIAITPESMTALMNSYVFGYQGAPVRNISMSIEGGRLIQRGTIHKGIDVKFEIAGSISATAEGKVRVHADSIKADHLPVKGLLHFLGEDLSKLLHQNAGKGIEVEGDDIILAPERLTPAPHILGRVRNASVSGSKIVLTFESGRGLAALQPPYRTAAYIYHRGGILRFGKLTMTDADLEIVGDRPGVFDFFQREYKKQLIAGYSKNTPSNGLVAHMADYARFESRRQAAALARP